MPETIKMRQLYASIGKLITSSLKIEEILGGIMEEVRRFFDAENWSLMRLDPNTRELFFVIIKGIDTKAVENIRLGLGEGIAGYVAKTGESVFVPDAKTDARFTDKVDRITGFDTRSVMAVPVIFKGTIYGVIELLNRTTGARYTDDEMLILQTIADFSAIAFANEALFQQVLMMGHTDPLTGLYNRLSLNQIIAESERDEGPQRRRSDQPRFAIVVLVDLNSFKAINDTLGHREGDAALVKTATLLRSRLRTNDQVFRIGGDEFLVLIREDDPDTLMRVETRIRAEMVKTCVFTIADGYRVEFAFGIASGPMSTLRELMHRADMEMYHCKKGRERA